ncbi:MAG: glycoside hydrolase family 65 protein, partial [Geminicoccaceae bacterium]
MSEWFLTYDGFDPDQEGLREALCVLGNGYVATRGAAPESDAGGCHYPGTYLAGGYNRLTTEIAGRVIENEDLVNLPNWLLLSIRIDGAGWFDLRKVELLEYQQQLDLRQGVLHRRLRCRDAKGQETRIDQRRLVHMGNPHLAALET